ncbi:MAG TPA: bifunctional diaminohydroxyphosphoribosylaminopyrimidine deaminase/5-amino-6-(5-phosphoribosylamino)uracil reductase RibD [Candidatus Magasanikbacteria bacterium]|nr:bifunctional diaminohydroxyphosphoribosylaminopyrimidine deaminase/5-amino-6-(5-phosphoribosylamino)uracil reductase RibD [Candidatus Magasanikbacteria bacterium]
MNIEFMQLALEEAKKGLGFTSPNPAVGAVLVRQGKIVAIGWHKHTGKDHAEVLAIKKIKNKNLLKNCELYITLEPCCHYGQTPPCVDLIVRSGIKKVYVGMKDPFVKVNGKGIIYLRKNGVAVEMCKDKRLVLEIKKINQPFLKWASVGWPYVVLKAAISLDGKIATKTGDSKWITNEKARQDARIERSLCDAVLVGSGTVKADDPELAPHGKYKNKKLLRIILDAELSTNVKAKVYRDKNIFVVCTNLATKMRQEVFAKANIKYKSFGKKKVDIKQLLDFFSKQGIQKIFVEGGGGVHGTFVDAHKKNGNVIDEIIFYLAPKIIGGREAKTVVGGEGINLVSDSLNLVSLDYKLINDNMKIRGRVSN